MWSNRTSPSPSSPRRRRVTVTLAAGLLGGVALTVTAASPRSARAQAGSTIGTLRIVRQVQVTRGVGQAAGYVPARDGEDVFAGQGVRTLKRSQAEINFRDRSVLRVNERTDLVVQDSASLRNIQLRGGVVWVRVAKGVRTQVETPSATAVARGTVFTVAVLEGGLTQLTVLEGAVDIQVGGKIVSVSAGQTITVTPDRAGSSGATVGSATDTRFNLPDAPTQLSASEMPIEFGGAVEGWWTGLGQNVGVVTTPGSSFVYDLRTSPLTEIIQQVASARPLGAAAPRDYFLPDPNERQLFFSNANPSLRNAWTQFLQNGSGFLNENGGASLATLGLNETQIAALQTLDINNVGDAVQTYQANAATAGIVVGLEGRGAYRASALSGPTNFDYRLLDRNDTSLAFVGVGAAAALLANGGKLSGTPLPTLTGQAFGFGGDPNVVGGRGRIDGAFGRTRYHMESNVIRLLTGNNSDTFSRLDSVLYVEHPVGDSVNLFAGRRRFYEGPAFQNQALSQLIADRYTGAGATFKSGQFSLTGAYLYDSNPDVRGAQAGGLGSAYVRGYGGVLGLHYLRVPKVRDGSGYSLSLTYPVLRNVVDFYGEVGRAADRTGIQTYGAYFPGLYQRTDLDLFLEYSSRESVGHTMSVIASRDLGPLFNVRAYAAFVDGTNDTRAGLAGIFRFSTR
jgi:ferric-dicitrate binding protein FerR (iron transport regulator)